MLTETTGQPGPAPGALFTITDTMGADTALCMGRVVQLAVDLGWADAEITDAAQLAAGAISGDWNELDDFDRLGWVVQPAAIAWLNANHCPAHHLYGWHGSFFCLMNDAWWAEHGGPDEL